MFERYGYEVSPAIEAIDAAVPGAGGLFDPGTTPSELRGALERVLDADDEPRPAGRRRESSGGTAVLYVDGSSRGNPGPAGAGAVIVDRGPGGDGRDGRDGGETLARLGRPVGSNAGNNVAEYAALLLGLDGLLCRLDPRALEVRIDSTTVGRDVWGDRGADVDEFRAYREAIADRLASVPEHDWVHLADDDPNPADALATVGADVAALGPGG